MKIGIQQRFFLSILTASGLAVLAMFLIIQWSINRGFLQFVNMMETEWLERLGGRLTEEYVTHGSWDFLAGTAPAHLLHWPPAPPGEHKPLPRSTLPPPPLPNDGPWHQPPPPPPDAPPDALREPRWRDSPPLPPPNGQDFATRLVLHDAEHHPVFGRAPEGIATHFIPLLHEGRKVGFLGLSPRQRLSDSRHLHFISGQKTILLLASAVVLCLAALFSLPLARGLLRPIRALAAGTRRLAAGEYACQVEVASSDELGRLARDFNDLAHALHKNEAARRHYMADIAHELRTPLAILRGEIEAVEDGVRQAGPETFRSLHAEVMQLNRLVDDLYQLALTDAGMLHYRKRPLELVPLLKEIVARFQPRFQAQQMELAARLPTQAASPLYADPERLHQLFANLLTNSLKYTDPGGRVELQLALENNTARITINDSAPGVAAQNLSRLFDRSPAHPRPLLRQGSGSGLGLAICHNIVTAHGGNISAQPSPLGGLGISVTLPLQERT